MDEDLSLFRERSLTDQIYPGLGRILVIYESHENEWLQWFLRVPYNYLKERENVFGLELGYAFQLHRKTSFSEDQNES